MPCTTSIFPFKFPPGSSRTWTWELVPSIQGIPIKNGEQTIFGYCHGNNLRDSIIITAPKYYGGLLGVSFKLGTPPNEISDLRDSRNATVIYGDTSKYFGTVDEEWQIKGYSVDSLANVYSNDSIFQDFMSKDTSGHQKKRLFPSNR